MKLLIMHARLTFFTQETLPKTEAEGQNQQGCHRGD